MLDIAIDADGEWDSSSGPDSTSWDELARAAATAAIAESAFPQLTSSERTVELSIRLASDAEVHVLNSEWRGKDKPTNVLSFPMADAEDLAESAAPGPELMLGDIILARGVCAAEAAEKAIPIESHAAHLMVHATLHLLGYDHLDEDSAADMEAREVRALARMGIADPYAGDR
jgi:probable rRNA maturation factor